MFKKSAFYNINGFFIEKNFFDVKEVQLLNNQATNIGVQWRPGELEQLRRDKLWIWVVWVNVNISVIAGSRVAFFESVLSEKLRHLISGVFGDEIQSHNTRSNRRWVCIAEFRWLPKPALCSCRAATVAATRNKNLWNDRRWLPRRRYLTSITSV